MERSLRSASKRRMKQINAASDLSTIPADSIAKVEIIKGPGPVQYGTDYKGGVILVTTKNGKGAGKFRVSIAAVGSHGATVSRQMPQSHTTVKMY